MSYIILFKIMYLLSGEMFTSKFMLLLVFPPILAVYCENDEFCVFNPEFQKIAMATAIGFAIMGFIGFFVKLIHIPINNIIV